MGIESFISNFAGGARANRFAVSIIWPAGVTNPGIPDSIVVSAAQLPACVMGVAHAPYMGRAIPIPGDRTFEDWTITVLNDTTFAHRNAFETWSNLILMNRANIQGTPDYRSITTTLTVNQLDRQDNIIKTFQILNAWPTIVTAIDLAYDQNDTIETYSVTFAYASWQSNTTS